MDTLDQIKAIRKMITKQRRAALENMRYQRDKTKNRVNTAFWDGAAFGMMLIRDELKKLK